jgi:hypothetical protein
MVFVWEIHMRLFRPVGLKEMELIASSGYRSFPPRLAWQPIFYPVLTVEYARRIVTQWNSKEGDSGHCGFVTEFDVDDEFVRRYPVQQLGGGPIFRELWVPAEELHEFNGQITGPIRVIEKVYGPGFEGAIDEMTGLPQSVIQATHSTGVKG